MKPNKTNWLRLTDLKTGMMVKVAYPLSLNPYQNPYTSDYETQYRVDGLYLLVVETWEEVIYPNSQKLMQGPYFTAKFLMPGNKFGYCSIHRVDVVDLYGNPFAYELQL